MTTVDLTMLKSRAVAGLIAEAATEWRLLTYRDLREALLTRTGVQLSGTFDEWHRLGDVSGYLLERGLPMASGIVVNERHGLTPGASFMGWVVQERTGRDPAEVPEDEKRRIVADEQLETFRRADEIMEAVRHWTIA